MLWPEFAFFISYVENTHQNKLEEETTVFVFEVVAIFSCVKPLSYKPERSSVVISDFYSSAREPPVSPEELLGEYKRSA